MMWITFFILVIRAFYISLFVSCVVFINGCVSIINYYIKREKSHYFGFESERKNNVSNGLNTICSFLMKP